MENSRQQTTDSQLNLRSKFNMPIIESAKKALKQSRKRQINNLKKKKAIQEIKKKTKSAKDLSKAQSVLDKAAKTGYIHKNKAARLKSRLAKRVAGK